MSAFRPFQPPHDEACPVCREERLAADDDAGLPAAICALVSILLAVALGWAGVWWLSLMHASATGRGL